MSESLTEFLLARIAEDEAVARAAIADDGGSDEGFSGQYPALIQPPSGIGIAQGGFGEAAARMIATYAVPARVLAECEAKREIIAECGSTIGNDQGPSANVLASIVLEALALPYADHPDYREEWRA